MRIYLPATCVTITVSGTLSFHVIVGIGNVLGCIRPKLDACFPPPPKLATPALKYSFTELNNAFEGAGDGIGLDNGLDYSMGIDVSAWGADNGNWPGDQFVNNGPSMGM